MDLSNPDTIKWLIGGLASTIVVLVGAVAALFHASFRVGRVYGMLESTQRKLDEALVELKKQGESLARIPVLERALEELRNVTSRSVSDIRDLVRRVAHLEGRDEGRRQSTTNERD